MNPIKYLICRYIRKRHIWDEYETYYEGVYRVVRCKFCSYEEIIE